MLRGDEAPATVGGGDPQDTGEAAGAEQARAGGRGGRVGRTNLQPPTLPASTGNFLRLVEILNQEADLLNTISMSEYKIEGEVCTDTAEDGPLAGLTEAVPGGRRVLSPPAHLTHTPAI